MKVIIVEYNQQWPKLFEQERDLLLSALGQPVAKIEHIGSTSVPGLVSKPIIDIMVGLNDFYMADNIVPRVQELGYTYVPEYEDVMPDRRFFRKLQHGNITHHIHMVEIASTFWERHLLFRDYLRANPEVVGEYALLKRELAKRDWDDSNDFAEAKTQFIKRVEEEAKRKMPTLYDNPKYYEIAFSFRDITFEVDVFEECFKRFSHIPVKSILELGCGNSPHMEELVERGYEYTGLDLSDTMLEYSQGKASRLDGKINLVKANLVNFSLGASFDFIYVTLGSLYVKSTSELISHFKSVEKALKKGGLYLLDWCLQFNPLSNRQEGWEIEKNGIKVRTTISCRCINPVEQTFEENISLEVNDSGKEQTIWQSKIKRAIFPQEFLCLIRTFEHFEFVGWWNDWDLKQPLEGIEKVNRPIVLVRRI